MMTEAQHPLVTDYLRRLREATATLPPTVAVELVADIEEHLDSANLGARSEADVRQALDRLGSPEEVAAAAGPELPPLSSPDALIASSPPAAGTHRLESVALLLLVLAEVLFIVVPLSAPLWVAGVVCLVLATGWTAREKVAAAAFVATGFPLVGLGVVVSALVVAELGACSASSTSTGDVIETCTTTTSPLGVILPALLVAYVVAQVVVIRRLLRSLR